LRPAIQRHRQAAWAKCFCAVAGIIMALAGQSLASAELTNTGIVAWVEREYQQARSRYQGDTNSDGAAGDFARASFEFAEVATNTAQRALLAEQGIDVCRRLTARRPDLALGHYYLGLNLGQLADTRRNLSALKIVREMEQEFLRAIELDEGLDYAGPNRTLGMLYLQAPVIGSIGSRTKARQRLKRAVELAPDYPGNRLNLGEAYLKWGEFNPALREVKALDELWPEARQKFSGERWAASWVDWEQRLKTARKRIENAAKTIQPPRQAP
jgi:tetratricopeptide (TPR) repeat protein